MLVMPLGEVRETGVMPHVAEYFVELSASPSGSLMTRRLGRGRWHNSDLDLDILPIGDPWIIG